MANQPTPVRPWFRLVSVRAPTPAAQPRPVLQTRPTFRGIAPTMQPQPSESPQSQASRPAGTTPAAVPTTAPPAPDPTAAVTTVSTASSVTSVPASPVAGKDSAPSASLPTSPIQKAPSPPRAVLPAPTLSSVPSSPQVKPSVRSSSVPTSPIPRPVTTNVTFAQSPQVTKVSGSLPASPPAAVVPAPTVPSVLSSPLPKVSAPLSSVQASIPRAFSSSNFIPTTQKTTQATQNSEKISSPESMRPAVKTPPQSPIMKVTAPPPSPLTLSPSQLKPREETVPKILVEAEQKTVLVQETIEKPKSLYKGNGGDLMRSSSEVRKSAILHNGKKASDSEDVFSRIITLAGENKGAVMELIQSPKKHVFGSNSTIRTVGGHREHHGSSSSNEDDNVKRKDKSHDGKTKASPPWTAYMNSNVQCINNSIMYGGKCEHNDPGVHFNHSRKPISKQLEHKEGVVDYHHD